MTGYRGLRGFSSRDPSPLPGGWTSKVRAGPGRLLPRPLLGLLSVCSHGRLLRGLLLSPPPALTGTPPRPPPYFNLTRLQGAVSEVRARASAEEPGRDTAASVVFLLCEGGHPSDARPSPDRGITPCLSRCLPPRGLGGHLRPAGSVLVSSRPSTGSPCSRPAAGREAEAREVDSQQQRAVWGRDRRGGGERSPVPLLTSGLGR